MSRRVLGAVLRADEVDRIRAVLYLSGLRGDDLEDAAQEVQLRVLERGPEDLRRPVDWASVVAANLARDWHRRSGRSRAAMTRLTAHAPVRSERDLALKIAVEAGLAKLDPDQREAVVLRFYLDLAVLDIASLLGIPEGTVKSRLHRAVAVMRQLLPKESMT